MSGLEGWGDCEGVGVGVWGGDGEVGVVGEVVSISEVGGDGAEGGVGFWGD